ncbi:hypothetical protein D3C81_07800 [compost metagenome]
MEVKDMLTQFVGSRYLDDNLEAFFAKYKKELRGTFYRGLPFPLHLLKEGAVIEEWHGSTHWTLDKEKAIGFSKDYINEEYEAELIAALGEDKVKFVNLVLYTKELEGVELYKLLVLQNIIDFIAEKEITVVGKNFEIVSIKVEDAIYYAHVKMINKEDV